MDANSSELKRPLAVGVGEVLYDCFPDRMILGGAPANFAVHANQLLAPVGGSGVVLSRVGEDELGRRLIGELANRKVVTNFVQTDPQLPTGTVQVTVSESGEPDYQIVEDVAWDHLAFAQSLEFLAAKCNAICFGTLAQRSEMSRATILKFVETAKSAIRLLDVNLRQSYYSADILTASLDQANALKLNQNELLQISKLLSHRLGAAKGDDDIVAKLQQSFELDCVAVTRGSRGTALYCDGQKHESEPCNITIGPGADSVGAGDACAAGLIYGLLQEWSPQQTVTLADRMGAFVASQAGATPRLPTDILEFALTAETSA